MAMAILSPEEEGRWHRFHIVALLICLGGSTYGLTISRPILQRVAVQAPWAETLQFWYPITTTCFQFGTAFMLLSLGWLLAPVFKYCIPSSRRVSDDATNIRSKISRRIILSAISRLALVVAFEAWWGSYAIYYAPIEVYLLSRGFILLGCQLLLRSGSSWRPRPIWCSGVMLLTSGVAAYRPGLPFPRLVIFASIGSCISAAVSIFYIEEVSKALASTSKEEYIQLDTRDSHNDTKTTHILDADMLLNLSYWTSLLSFLLLIPIVLLSGELGHIWRNCYFLDVPLFWVILTAGGLFRCILLVSTILLINATSIFDTAFFIVLINVSQVAFLSYWELILSQKLGLLSCLALVAWLYRDAISQFASDVVGATETPRYGNSIQKLSRRSLVIVTAMALGLIGVVSIVRGFDSHNGIDNTHIPLGKAIGTINAEHPLLNGTEAYLGQRPHGLAYADLELLTQECRGSYEQMEHMRNVSKCLEFLSTRESLYLKNIDGKNPSLDSKYTYVNGHEQYKTCPVEGIKYHIWWSGPPTWRIELFIKGYLFTQDYLCAHLIIWVNMDNNSGAIEVWRKSPYFQKFLPLEETGFVTLMEWRLPDRVVLSNDINERDAARYYAGHEPAGAFQDGDKPMLVADSVTRSGIWEYLQIYKQNEELQITHFPVAASDAARLTILHRHGGVYVDVDMILLRDMAPLVASGLPFAERWGSHEEKIYYNNAVVSLPRQSSMSSYLLRAGTRMGYVYHFIALARMLVKEGMDDRSMQGLQRMETAFFDPIMGEIDGLTVGKCTVPCLTDFEDIFKARPARREWESFEGEGIPGRGNNRTLENFYRGAYAYHMHNKWNMRYEAGSWLDVICRAHDEFLNGERTNAYGETWKAGPIRRYGE